MVAELAALLAAIMVLAADLIHARRIQRLSRLAFGPTGCPRGWVTAVPFLRAVAVAGLMWGLFTLALLPPKVHRAATVDRSKLRHLILLLDVSPSMRLEDAGPSKKQARRARAKDLIQSFLARSGAEFKISVVAFYTEAKPVVVDTIDMEVVRNILGDLPMSFAFDAGETHLFKGLEEATKLAYPWKPEDATLLVVTDGDTVPATGMPKLPASINHVLIVGVGDTRAGSFIDGRQSRQDTATLRQTAARLSGHYHDGNEKQIPTDVVRFVSSTGRTSPFESLTRREYALLACTLGVLIFAGLPWALHAYGSAWQSRVPLGSEPQSRRVGTKILPRKSWTFGKTKSSGSATQDTIA